MLYPSLSSSTSPDANAIQIYTQACGMLASPVLAPMDAGVRDALHQVALTAFAATSDRALTTPGLTGNLSHASILTAAITSATPAIIWAVVGRLVALHTKPGPCVLPVSIDPYVGSPTLDTAMAAITDAGGYFSLHSMLTTLAKALEQDQHACVRTLRAKAAAFRLGGHQEWGHIIQMLWNKSKRHAAILLEVVRTAIAADPPHCTPALAQAVLDPTGLSLAVLLRLHPGAIEGVLHPEWAMQQVAMPLRPFVQATTSAHARLSIHQWDWSLDELIAMPRPTAQRAAWKALGLPSMRAQRRARKEQRQAERGRTLGPIGGTQRPPR